VLDDEDDELDKLPLFQPSATTGITDRMVKALSQYLLEETNDDTRSNRLERVLQNFASVFRGHRG
jgi:hypothetical protein